MELKLRLNVKSENVCMLPEDRHTLFDIKIYIKWHFNAMAQMAGGINKTNTIYTKIK